MALYRGTFLKTTKKIVYEKIECTIADHMTKTQWIFKSSDDNGPRYLIENSLILTRVRNVLSLFSLVPRISEFLNSLYPFGMESLVLFQ